MMGLAQALSSSADSVRFGTILRRFRKRLPQSQKSEEDPRSVDAQPISIRQARRALEQHGLQISVRAYRDIESGISLPQNCALFLECIAECFSLSDEEVEFLTLLLARNVLRDALGEELVDELFGPSPEDPTPTRPLYM
jgi:hypothetical protein